MIRVRILAFLGHGNGREPSVDDIQPIDAQLAVIGIEVSDGTAVIGNVPLPLEAKRAVVSGAIRDLTGAQNVAIVLERSARVLQNRRLDAGGAASQF